jgi:sterol desaturase/sphingolipid hydroxylase (fatty acid hydroxylase superfamily)
MPNLATDLPLPLLFLQTFVTQAIGYFAVVGVVFLVVWKLAGRRLASRRIQATQRFDRKQLGAEVRNTLVTMAIGTVSALVIALLHTRGITKLTTNLDDVGGLPVVVASVVGLVLFNDAWFYAWHRALHTPRLFRWVHAVHHKSVDVNPFSSYSFHAFEGFILGAWTIPFVVLVPFYLPALGLLQGVGLANNVMAHLGYELLPRWWVRAPLLRWTNTSTFHNLHHTRLQGNYGLFTRFWDRALGTELPEYERVFSDRDAVRLSGADER